MRVYLRALKNLRGFQARAMRNFGVKKANKPFSFENEKSQKEKNLCQQSYTKSMMVQFSFYWINKTNNKKQLFYC